MDRARSISADFDSTVSHGRTQGQQVGSAQATFTAFPFACLPTIAVWQVSSITIFLASLLKQNHFLILVAISQDLSYHHAATASATELETTMSFINLLAKSARPNPTDQSLIQNMSNEPAGSNT